MIPIGPIKTQPDRKPNRLGSSALGQSQTAGGKHDFEIVLGFVIVGCLIWHWANGYWAAAWFGWPLVLGVIGIVLKMQA
jgi:fatty acid desaturase